MLSCMFVKPASFYSIIQTNGVVVQPTCPYELCLERLKKEGGVRLRGNLLQNVTRVISTSTKLESYIVTQRLASKVNVTTSH